MTEFKDKKNLTTPKGELYFVSHKTPNNYDKLSVNLRLPKKEAEAFINEWKDFMKESGFKFDKNPNLIIPTAKPAKDRDGEVLEDYLDLVFQNKPSFKLSDDTEVKRTIKLIGADGKPMVSEPPYIPNGTIGKVGVKVRTYGLGVKGSKQGVALDLLAIQILKLGAMKDSMFDADPEYMTDEEESDDSETDWEPQAKPAKKTTKTPNSELDDVIPF